MKIRSILVVLCLIFTVFPFAGCSQNSDNNVTFEQLFANPGGYNNQEITMESYFFQGFEIIVLCENLVDSGYAAGHLVPKGRMIWVEGGIPKAIYDTLMQQQMMGPTEKYGKVRVTGKFAYGGQYGHLGGYKSQIKPLEVVLLTWSKP